MVDTLETAQAMRHSSLPQEQANAIAEQTGKGFSSDLSWRLAGMLPLQAGLVVALRKLL